MRNPMDLTGQRFGRLIVLRLGESVLYRCGSTERRWICQCDCGKTTITTQKALCSGVTRSCGCFKRDMWGKRIRRHGQSDTRVYRIWVCMVGRCYNRNNTHYKDYGGRGIAICERWRKSFEAFYEDMGEPPEGTSIDRKDNNGPYCKENCRWATRKQQQNNMRSNRRITFNGETHTLSEWARKIGLAKSTLRGRLNSGWPLAKALNQY